MNCKVPSVGLAILLAALCWPRPVVAQSLDDSVQLITLAVRGFRSPNGSLTEISRHVICFSFPPRSNLCQSSQTSKYHPPSLLSAVSTALSLPAANDPDTTTLVCPWVRDPHAAHTGVSLGFGQLQFLGDSALIFVGRSCHGTRGAFFEGGFAVLRRMNGIWTFSVMRNGFIT
jgi:hypothetical protein